MGKKSKQTSAPSKYAQPYITNAANTLQTAVAGNQGNIDAISGQMQGLLPGLASRIGNDPLAGQAKAYANDVLGGRYLGANPYLDGMVNEARAGAFDTVNAGFGRSGMAGGTTHMQSLGRGLGQAELGLRYNDYAGERARMDGMANSAGQISIADLAALPSYLGLADSAATVPLTNAQALASGMGGLMGNYTTTTQKQGGLGSALGGLAGLGLQAYGLGMFGK